MYHNQNSDDLNKTFQVKNKLNFKYNYASVLYLFVYIRQICSALTEERCALLATFEIIIRVINGLLQLLMCLKIKAYLRIEYLTDNCILKKNLWHIIHRNVIYH